MDVPEDYRVIFTSTGTEANNLAINGMRHSVDKVFTSNIEHSSVLQTVGEGLISVDKDGRFLEQDLLEQIFLGQNLENRYNHDTRKGLGKKNLISNSQNHLFSLMLANNEVGTIQDIEKITNNIRANGHIIHTDATQAIGKIPVSVKKLGVDMLTISGHKFGGSLGAGALIYREILDLKPIIYGGGQEYRLRSGTTNVMSIHGMGIACEHIKRNCSIMREDILKLRHFIENEIGDDYNSRHDVRTGYCDNMAFKTKQESYGSQAETIEALGKSKSSGSKVQNGAVIFAKYADRLPNTVSIAMPNVSADVQVAYFDSKGISVSAGSACSSAKTASIPYVQMAMGYDYDIAKCAIRVSLGVTTTQKDVELFVDAWHELNRSTKNNRRGKE